MTARTVIPAVHRPGWPAPNLAERSAPFSWDVARGLLDGLPGGRGLNIAHEAVDRHAAGPRADKVALRFVGRQGRREDLTYAELASRSNRFANALADLGVQAGEVVFLLLPRQPALYVAALGAWKRRCVVSPLFPAFGPEPVRQRMRLGDGRVLVTTPALYHRRVEPVRADLPGLRHVLLAGDELDALLAASDDRFEIPPTDPEDLALLHFTSGTTGTPKGAMHVHGAVVAHHVTGAHALDLHPADVFWCTADPGWVTGTSYGIVSPLTHGVTSIVDEGDFDAERWYGVLADEQVTVWYTAPTAIRMLMRAGPEPRRGHDLAQLRFVASVGEALNPEAVIWGQEALGLPIHDNWWQTETGGIMIANVASDDIRPGSMGRPLPGIEAAVVAVDDEGMPLVRDTQPVPVGPDTTGQLALRAGWPSMFRGYLHDEERYRRCFVGDWYLTGDLARVDPDGWFWFVGRADDVIKSAGHLIGPFEVESTLMEHPAVIEAGVVGLPDPVAGSTVKAFVSLRPGWEPSDELRLDIIGFARKRLGNAVAPRDVAFDQQLPKTESGKIVRRLLRARELGLAEGDTSTLVRR